MRIAAYNVKRCERGLGAVARVLASAEPDAVALNEIVTSQANELAVRLGMFAVPGPVLPLLGYGNALLLRTPPAWTRAVRFRRVHGIERRGCVAAGAGGLAVAATHLATQAKVRREQARELLAFLARWPTVVLAGDLNDRPGGPAGTVLAVRFRDAFEAHGTGTGHTFPSASPERRIDYVLVTADVRVSRCEIIESSASDHLPLVADLELPARG